MEKITKNWANPEHYVAVRKLLEAENKKGATLDLKNPYIYEPILVNSGFDVFMGDLKPWVKAQDFDVSGLKLDLEVK